jgi:hypothetical protein
VCSNAHTANGLKKTVLNILNETYTAYYQNKEGNRENNQAFETSAATLPLTSDSSTEGFLVRGPSNQNGRP